MEPMSFILLLGVLVILGMFAAFIISPFVIGLFFILVSFGEASEMRKLRKKR
jgi:hypothetical protein